MGKMKPEGRSKRKVSVGAGNDYPRADMGPEAIHRGDKSPFHLASVQVSSELTAKVLKKG